MPTPTAEEDSAFNRHYTDALKHLERKEFHQAYDQALQSSLLRPMNEAAYEVLSLAVSRAYSAGDQYLWRRWRPIQAAHNEFVSSVIQTEDNSDRGPSSYGHILDSDDEKIFSEWCLRWRMAWTQFRA
jgi:hypothetical protein